MAENNQVEKFDPSKLMEGVKDRIKASFVSLIPDEQWDQMVKKEIDDFFNPKDRSYNSREYKSDFQILVRNELTKYASERFISYLHGPEFAIIYSNNGIPKESEAINKFLKENGGELVSIFFGGMLSSALCTAINSVRPNSLGHF